MLGGKGRVVAQGILAMLRACLLAVERGKQGNNALVSP